MAADIADHRRGPERLRELPSRGRARSGRGAQIDGSGGDTGRTGRSGALSGGTGRSELDRVPGFSQSRRGVVNESDGGTASSSTATAAGASCASIGSQAPAADLVRAALGPGRAGAPWAARSARSTVAAGAAGRCLDHAVGDADSGRAEEHDAERAAAAVATHSSTPTLSAAAASSSPVSRARVRIDSGTAARASASSASATAIAGGP